MKNIALIVLILFCFQTGWSQKHIDDSITPYHMEKTFLGLRTVGYTVGDLQKAKKWYTQAFEVEPYFDEPYYVGFNIGGYELGLQPEQTPSTEKATGVVAYWGVNDIQATYERLIRLGAKSNEPPQNVGDELMVATVIDPWGNIIGIIYNPYFKLEE